MPTITEGTPDFQVRIHVLHEREVFRGVERIWQMSCTSPASMLESFGSLVIGRAMDMRLQRMSELSLSGRITLGRSWAALQVDGSFLAVMMVTQFESDDEVCAERLRLENSNKADCEHLRRKMVGMLWRKLNGGKPLA